MRAPTLAIPLLVPRPKARVAVGYTCRDERRLRRLSCCWLPFSQLLILSELTSYLWRVHVGGLKSACDESSRDEYQHCHGCSATGKTVTPDKNSGSTIYYDF